MLTRHNKILNRGVQLNKKIKNIIKFCIFISIAIIPLITVTINLGLNMFLDSFENPQYYLSIENNKLLNGVNANQQVLIIQKSSHPEFYVENNDEIIYFTKNREILCSKVYEINSINTKNKFYKVNYNNPNSEIICENQILGKIIKIMDNNIWNLISIKVWDISIHNLNLIVLTKNN